MIFLIFLAQVILGLPFYKSNPHLSEFIPNIFLLFWIFYKKRPWINELLMTQTKKIEKKNLNISIVFCILVPLLINFAYMIFDRKGFEAEVFKYRGPAPREAFYFHKK